MAPDRISDLPDDLIRHILSFLPSTKEAIRTGILSKRWHMQWTHVSVLIFRSMGMGRADFLHKTLALHDCSKVNTVYFRYDRQRYRKVALCDEIIRFATTRQVENLTLKCDSIPGYSLPAFLFNTTSLVKLRTRDCWCYPTATVNWVSLKALSLVRCKVSDQSMQCILSGSPLLESLEVKRCYPVFRGAYRFDKLVITSKSLEKLVLRSLGVKNLEVSCPNLEELCVEDFSAGDPKLSDRAIEYVVSNSLLLESCELRRCRVLHHPVIASRSLKRLVMSDISCSNGFEISCQGLEKLELSGFMNIAYVDFRDVPSSLCASLSFRIQGSANSLSEDILKQLQHIKELRVENVIYNYRATSNLKLQRFCRLPAA